MPENVAYRSFAWRSTTHQGKMQVEETACSLNETKNRDFPNESMVRRTNALAVTLAVASVLVVLGNAQTPSVLAVEGLLRRLLPAQQADQYVCGMMLDRFRFTIALACRFILEVQPAAISGNESSTLTGFFEISSTPCRLCFDVESRSSSSSYIE